MRIAGLGTRGFPDIQGGVEAHCAQLYPRLAKMGCEITVFAREPYAGPGARDYKGIDIVPIPCPKSRSLEAIVHTYRSLLAARRIRPDIVHIHAIGPSLLVPLARLLGLKVVMTNHGPDYMRQKWGPIAKLALMTGEMFGSLFANKIIVISKTIADHIKSRYSKETDLIPNGVEVLERLESKEALTKYSIEGGRYLLAVGRFVPEKGFADLVEAFGACGLDGWKLVIVGEADHKGRYSQDLKEACSNNSDIILTGFLSGQLLHELYSHAGIFVLPSYYEGLPISLLEAMSYGLLCLASDIPANRAVDLPDNNYFRRADVKGLTEKLKESARQPISDEARRSQVELISQRYDWAKIAEETLEIYKAISS